MSQPQGPAPGAPATALSPEAVADRLGDIVAELLGRRIDPTENFFEAGLSSLTVTRLHALIASRLGVTIPETGLFSHPTLHDAAALVVAARQPATPAPRPAAAPERGAQRAADTRRGIRAELRRRQERR